MSEAKKTEWIVIETRVPVIAGEHGPESDLHVMPAIRVPKFASQEAAVEFSRELKRYREEAGVARDPVAMFDGHLYTFFGHVADPECPCQPTEEPGQEGQMIYTHKYPA